MEWIDFSDLEMDEGKCPWTFRLSKEHLNAHDTAACSDTLLLTMRSDELAKGEIKVVKDHVNLSAYNPLRGKNITEFGVRFPDMSNPYEKPKTIKDMDRVLIKAGQNKDHPFKALEASEIVYQTILAKHQKKKVFALLYGKDVKVEHLINIVGE